MVHRILPQCSSACHHASSQRKGFAKAEHTPLPSSLQVSARSTASDGSLRDPYRSWSNSHTSTRTPRKHNENNTSHMSLESTVQIPTSTATAMHHEIGSGEPHAGDGFSTTFYGMTVIRYRGACQTRPIHLQTECVLIFIPLDTDQVSSIMHNLEGESALSMLRTNTEGYLLGLREHDHTTLNCL